jgi:cytidylate kinase
MALKIAVSGLAGSGKSSLIKAMVQKYGIETIDIGQVFRQRWLAKWLTIAEYDKLVEMNPEEDVALDNDIRKIVEDCPNDIIVSRRMGFHVMPDVTSIRLDVSPEEGARRVFSQDRWNQEKKYADIAETMKSNQDRMERLRERLQKVYGVDFTDKSNYTKIIDTTGKTFEENFEQFDQYIQSLKK